MTLDLTLPSPEITRALCDIPSVSGAEADLADQIVRAVSNSPHLTVIRHGNTVVARTELGRARRVVIAGHIDTVPVNANLPTMLVERGGQPHLWGRGTVDMKAGVAVQLKLAVELTRPIYDLTWIWYDCEEVDSARNGLTRLAGSRPDLLQGDFAVLGEPTRGEVEGGCNGTLRAVVRTRGVRAHSARAWVGRNAIHAAAEVLQRLADYRPRTVRVDGLDYREGLSAVGISGGVAGNVIPDLCEIVVNHRFAPDRTAVEAQSHVRDVFEGFEVEVVDSAEGARPGLDSPFAQEFLRAVAVPAQAKYGWTDVARFSALGIPAVNYGPGDPLLAHHDDESVPLSQILSVENGLRTWLTSAETMS